jgi:hypothetical protein
MFFSHSLCTYLKNKTYIYFTMDIICYHDKNITGKHKLTWAKHLTASQHQNRNFQR